MKLGLLGRKVGMTRIYDENGVMVPVTVVDTTGCVVTQVKTRKTDGYNSLQLGIGTRKPQNVKKTAAGHFKKANVAATATVKELRFSEKDDLTGVALGSTISAGIFKKGDRVDVRGTMKGRGFAGVMKRHGFSGKNATHGTSKYFRHGGSAGSNTFPGRILKNKGMPGHMGDCPRTTQNLLVAEVRPEENLLLLKGAIPGSRNGVVMVRLATKTVTAADRSYFG